jgi:hypothetical protein
MTASGFYFSWRARRFSLSRASRDKMRGYRHEPDPANPELGRQTAQIKIKQ